jgi:hypothetical protein
MVVLSLRQWTDFYFCLLPACTFFFSCPCLKEKNVPGSIASVFGESRGARIVTFCIST